MLNNSCIFNLKNFFLILALLKVAKQSISSSISLALTVINMEIVVEELLGLANLAEAQVFHIHELT